MGSFRGLIHWLRSEGKKADRAARSAERVAVVSSVKQKKLELRTALDELAAARSQAGKNKT